MTNFYRATHKPKTKKYIMYGLLVAAVLLGLFYLYKRNQAQNSKNETSPTPVSTIIPTITKTTTSLKLTGTYWKTYMWPGYVPLGPDKYDFLVFDAQKGETVKIVEGKPKIVAELGVSYSDDGKMTGKLYDTEATNTKMTYKFEIDDTNKNVLVITTSDNKLYKLIQSINSPFKSSEPDHSRPSVVQHPDPAMRNTSRMFTLSELSEYDGTNYDKPLLLSFAGDVYDVSTGRNQYDKQGAYGFAAGRDVSRAFCTNCFQDACLLSDIGGMSAEQNDKRDQWHAMFERTYPRVGYVSKSELVSTPAQIKNSDDKVEEIRKLQNVARS